MFVSNTAAGGAGGAIYFNSAGALYIGNHSAFIANQVFNNPIRFNDLVPPSYSAAGGAIYVAAAHSPTTTITYTSFLNNTAQGVSSNGSGDASGGAIACLGGSLKIINSHFTGNQAVGADWAGFHG